MRQQKQKLELLDQQRDRGAKHSGDMVMTRGTCRGSVRAGQNAACGSLRAYATPAGTSDSERIDADVRRVLTAGLPGHEKRA